MKTMIKKGKTVSLIGLMMISSGLGLRAQESNLPQSLMNKMETVVDKNAAYIQEIYKDLHEHAELPFMEFRTAGVVARELESLGFTVKTGIGITGVVGVLENGDGPVFMYRADMDALGVEETSGLPYASRQRAVNRDGVETAVSHMCGHDANTTFLISLAHTMKEMKDHWSGTLVLVAQPAEELIEGAQAMIDDGLYTLHHTPKPDYFLAQHTTPLPTGTLLTTDGRVTTGSEQIDITFHGIGGHGSSPHHTIDPVVMAGMAIVQLQTVVSRTVDPEEVAVLTIGSVQAGVDNNVIPTEAVMKLKLHFSSPEVHERMVTSIYSIVNGIASSYNVPEELMPSFKHFGFAPATVNDTEFMEQIRSTADRAGFVKGRIDNQTLPASEDAFALIYGLEDVKGAYLFIGTTHPDLYEQAKAEGKEYPYNVHEPIYMVDLEGITYGSKLAALIALEILHD